MADQPYWGRRVHELGVGVKPVERHKLTADVLAAGISQLISDPLLKAETPLLGEKIRAEDGVANAVQVIERLAQ
jgi:UDP:flavonoid glycosyltransferase YjiC (YdhE family)